uniref:Uncharacterized protein n=1 Tax=Opuntia streptacantha TaxID=393608 RepID=A0A7C9AZ71_OPUST
MILVVTLAVFEQPECWLELEVALALQGVQYHPTLLCHYHADQFHSPVPPSHQLKLGMQEQVDQLNLHWTLCEWELAWHLHLNWHQSWQKEERHQNLLRLVLVQKLCPSTLSCSWPIPASLNFQEFQWLLYLHLQYPPSHYIASQSVEIDQLLQMPLTEHHCLDL